jgi:hypothetical protein
MDNPNRIRILNSAIRQLRDAKYFIILGKFERAEDEIANTLIFLSHTLRRLNNNRKLKRHREDVRGRSR